MRHVFPFRRPGRVHSRWPQRRQRRVQARRRRASQWWQRQVQGRGDGGGGGGREKVAVRRSGRGSRSEERGGPEGGKDGLRRPRPGEG
ncbi:hypothetical protein ColLi_06600 [Colletotrichum liriopes]|uniref:Uncharacterized protein n=1 Tax=Colletotrichum liriopes TaxID=708192 RepID=A0AA37GNN8_9PEZI|nr:hypothetical protein ColLi_06600 [Colletotrichum liriopes]